ncbi:Uncharacterized protein LSUE1_G000870, partial [Lachnellula suecica]
MNQMQNPEFRGRAPNGGPNRMASKIRSSGRNTIVLCFDGTGNKFHGDSSDSNILKIFRMLDRSSGLGFHYYQPGIGTYVTTTSLSTKGTIERFKNWYRKTKDTAVGTNFDQHVVGGYKFLMQYYSPGDDIFMFGFSRGAYTARFLAEMLDWIGLITFGNEEMVQFAWRTFSNWKQLVNSQDPDCQKRQQKAYEFMVSFRETFSRPVKRIRYLGLFDTYSAKSSAKVIRHAVSIDERRAKFRSDLIAPDTRHKKETDAAVLAHMQEKGDKDLHLHKPASREPNRFRRPSTAQKGMGKDSGINGEETDRNRFRRASMPLDGGARGFEAKETDPFRRASVPLKIGITTDRGDFKPLLDPFPEHERHNDRLGSGSITRYRTRSRSRSRSTCGSGDRSRRESPHGHSYDTINTPSDDESEVDEDEEEQDIEELWFSGGHGDIGGGWQLEEGEVPLAHLPLVWIVLEAKKAGLQLDEDKMRMMGCFDDSDMLTSDTPGLPKIEVSPESGKEVAAGSEGGEMRFGDRILHCSTKSRTHDCLAFDQGLPSLSVFIWSVMEWIPFKRMDLRDDGSWNPIRWPLPRGEVRDMPDEAKVHHSAIKRMQANPHYRPGNLILGGGGRGMKKAPADAGIGEWELVGKKGDLLGECF